MLKFSGIKHALCAIALFIAASPASAIIAGGGSLNDGIPSLVYNALDGSVWIETGAAFGGPPSLYNVSLQSEEGIFNPFRATGVVGAANDFFIQTVPSLELPDGTVLGEPGFMFDFEQESFLLDDLTFVFQTDPFGSAFTSDLVYFTGIVEPVVGDLDDDGFVGIDDLNIVLAVWNQTVPSADPRADPSGDGFVGIDDLGFVLGNWNAGAPAAATVPEPGTAATLLLLSLAATRRRKR